MSIGSGNICYPSYRYAPITLYWDANGTSVGATNSTTATGTWGTNSYWTTDPAGLLATRAWIQGSDAVFAAGSNATGSYTVTVNGLQTVRNLLVRNGTLTFASGNLQIAPGAQWDNSTAGAVSMGTALRFTNTLTVKSGPWSITSASSVGSGGLIIDGNTAWVFSTNANSFGTGVITIKNGRLSMGDNNGRTFTATIRIEGSCTLGDISPAGSLAFAAGQSIVAPVIITALSNVAFDATMQWGSNVITYRGPGTVTQGSTVDAATNTGAITVGDGITFSGNNVGGNLAANTQTAMGSGAYVVNYGGSLNASNPSLILTNSITINAGGTIGIRGAQTGASWAFNSLAGLTSTLSGDFIGVASLSLPSAGALFFSPGNGMALGRPYPALTGTMAFGGSSSQGVSATVSATTLSSINGSPRTLAFNQTGGGAFTYTGGLTLNANLVIAGSGNGGLNGLYPSGGAGNLGTIGASAQAITVAMSPSAEVHAAYTATGYTGGITLSSGVFGVTGLTNALSGRMFGGGSVLINGGGIRDQASRSGAATITDPLVIGIKGGALGSYTSQNSETIFSGAISKDVGGAGPLVLRVGVSANFNRFALAGSNIAFDAGFILDTSSRGAFRFDSLAAMGSDGSNTGGNTATPNPITVPAGIVFGFGSNALFTAAVLARFTTQTESILALDNKTGNIDLSAAGLNKDVRLGFMATANNTTITFAGSITPYNSTVGYKFAPPFSLNGGAMLLSGVNALTGANPLDVATGAVIPTSAMAAVGALAIAASQDYSGVTVVRGVATNSLMGSSVSGPTLFLTNNGVASQGDLTGTSSLLINLGATVGLPGTAANYGRITVANLPITVMGSGTLNCGETIPNNEASNRNVTNRINPSARLILGGTTGGGTFNIPYPDAGAYTHSQTLYSLSIQAGISSISSSNIKASSVNLAFTGTAGGAGYTRAVGGVVNQFTNTGFIPSFTNAPTTAGGSSVSGAGGNALLIGATQGFVPGVDGGDYIAAASGTFGPPAYTSQNDCSLWAAGQNIKAGTLTGTIANDVAINSLRVTLGSGTITIATGKTLTVTSGMIASTINGVVAITGGALTTGNGLDLIVGSHQNSFIIASQITGGYAFTKFLANTVTLSNANNAIGDIYILAGTLTAGASGSLGGLTAPRTIYLMGGVLFFSHALDIYSNTNIVVGAAGGYIGTPNSAGTGAVIQGSVTLHGPLAVNPVNMTGRVELSGTISGAGSIRHVNSYGQGGDYSLLILSGDNSAWSGGFALQESGAQAGAINLRLAKGASAGTGPIVTGGKGGNLLLDTASISDSVYPNNFSLLGPLGLTVWSLGPGLSTSGGTRATLSGMFVGSSSVIFQGYATGDNAITELVLSGTYSMSGIPTAPFGGTAASNYGTSSLKQNLVNGYGGLTLGLFGVYPTVLPVGTATQGALGFIRFSGVNSFLPGAVGPGYISAVHRATDTVDHTAHFGFLLTATSGAGTTYQIPEGKSFLIGSLGTADPTLNKQIGGVLGASSDAGSGSNLATLLGSPKYAAGQTLAGMFGGDINIHANADTDNQVLKMFVRHAGDTMVLGSTETREVIFCPTWGDSGGQSCLTMVRKRTGATTLIKVGAGTLVIAEADYTHTDGTSARGSFTWSLVEGTLLYNHNDNDEGVRPDFAAFNVGAGTTLGGSGVLNSVVTVTSGTMSPGTPVATAALSMKSLNLNNSGATVILDLNGDAAGTQYDQLVIPSTGDGVVLNNATLSIRLGYSPAVGKVFTIIDRQSAGPVTGVFNGLPEGATVASTGTVRNFTISYVGGDGNDVTLTAQ